VYGNFAGSILEKNTHWTLLIVLIKLSLNVTSQRMNERKEGKKKRNRKKIKNTLLQKITHNPQSAIKFC
jgi:hypothetical protein